MVHITTDRVVPQPLTPRALFARTFRRGPRPDEYRDEIFQRAIHGTAIIAPVANWANAACITVLAAFVIPPTMTAFRPLWTAIALLVALHPVMWWGPRLREPARRAGPLDVVLLSLEGVALALVYASLLWHLRSEVVPGQAVVLCSTIAGVLGCGAVARSLNRAVGIMWVLSNSVALTVVLIARPGAGGSVLIGQLNLYAFVLLVAICYLSASFELRCRAELAAADERGVVELLLDDLEGGARDWLWRTDAAGGLVQVSARFAERAGLAVADLEGRPLIGALVRLGATAHPDGPRALDELARRLVLTEPFRELVVPVTVDGELRWWALSGQRAEATRLGPAGWHGVANDITEARRHAKEIDRLVNHDSLTGLFNRHRFHELLADLTGDSPDGIVFAVGIVDLDNFKGVNDTLGHHVGDELLVQVATRLAGVLRINDICARLGGDEFALIVPAASSRAAAQHFEELLAALVHPFEVARSRLEVRASAGFAMYPHDSREVDELITLADQALYAAKEAGRGHARAFVPKMRERAVARANALHELAVALERFEFELHVQPIVELATGSIASFEALVRWRHPHRGLILPADFIQVAEETGLIVSLGEQILDMAFTAAASWPDGMRVAVNISPVQLTSAGFAETLEGLRRASAIEPGRVDLEVTESTVVDDRAHRVLGELRSAGYGIVIDDFGTGYSSFATLQSGQVTQIKIDRAFVQQLTGEPAGPTIAIVRSIVQASQALGLETVAEGVETVHQRDLLSHLGCEAMQGYLESRPFPIAEVPRYLDARVRSRRAGFSAVAGELQPSLGDDAAQHL